jgi:hypothetical protein
MKSNSKARWTIVPFVVATPGASGSFWMLANRNCRGQLVKAETRDGDSDVGTVYAPGMDAADRADSDDGVDSGDRVDSEAGASLRSVMFQHRTPGV